MQLRMRPGVSPRCSLRRVVEPLDGTLISLRSTRAREASTMTPITTRIEVATFQLLSRNELTLKNADPLNFQEKLVAILRTPFRPVAWRLLKLYGIELPPGVPVGPGIRLPHGAVGLVIHESTVIGANVKIFQGVTIGRSDQYLRREELAQDGRVIVEDDVILGAGAKVLFRSGHTLIIGRGAVVGANSVVTRSIPAGEIWAGVPAKKVSDNPSFNTTDRRDGRPESASK